MAQTWLHQIKNFKIARQYNLKQFLVSIVLCGPNKIEQIFEPASRAEARQLSKSMVTFIYYLFPWRLVVLKENKTNVDLFYCL